MFSRQRMVMKTAIKSHEIVANLFPEVVRNRLFGDGASEEIMDMDGGDHTNTMRDGDDEPGVSEYLNKPSMMNFSPTGDGTRKLKPIADLFPNTTVLFADIAGFTAWSSVRDPSQVFILLETVYAAFDKVALSRQVFKVETIGDCYVAVTGLPNPQENHAVIMVKFARDCLRTMQTLTQSLEVELGPDTGDLAIRIGMHSGPVTAGVLRGQKSRFQLFGDTVNFASRMESNGFPNQIQCSQQTADLLVNAGKQNWIHARKDMVHAKGKGEVQTYWVIATRAVSSTGSSRSLGYDDDDDSDITEEPLNDLGESSAGISAGYLHSGPHERQEQSPNQYPEPAQRADLSPHMQRLIKWNVDTLAKAIKKIVATRSAREKQLQTANELRAKQGTNGGVGMSPRISHMTIDSNVAVNCDKKNDEDEKDESSKAPKLVILTNPRSEYTEAIELPKFDPFKVVRRSAELAAEVHLSHTVMQQLNDFVTTIACAYNDNPFHNFEVRGLEIVQSVAWLS
jgi:class 3 adenylate cyclase